METRVRIIFYLHVLVTIYLMLGAYLDGRIFPDTPVFGLFALAVPIAFPIVAAVGLRRSVCNRRGAVMAGHIFMSVATIVFVLLPAE
jgi:hypothetical protein